MNERHGRSCTRLTPPPPPPPTTRHDTATGHRLLPAPPADGGRRRREGGGASSFIVGWCLWLWWCWVVAPLPSLYINQSTNHKKHKMYTNTAFFSALKTAAGAAGGRGGAPGPGALRLHHAGGSAPGIVHVLIHIHIYYIIYVCLCGGLGTYVKRSHHIDLT